MMPGEGTKGSDIYREYNQGSDRVRVRVTMVTGVRHNEQPGDLEAKEGAHVTGLLLHKPLIAPYNTERVIYFLVDLQNRLVPAEERGTRNSPTFVVVWDNVAFHHSAAVTDWFAAHPRMSVLFLPPYSPS